MIVLMFWVMTFVNVLLTIDFYQMNLLLLCDLIVQMSEDRRGHSAGRC